MLYAQRFRKSFKLQHFDIHYISKMRIDVNKIQFFLSTVNILIITLNEGYYDIILIMLNIVL